MNKLTILLGLLVFLFGCEPDKIPDIGEPFNRQEQLVGTWKLSSFIQIEEDAKSKGFPEFATKMDLTDVFEGHSYKDFSITLNADGTFTTELGTSYVEMLSDGSWKLDDVKFPTAILLTKGSETQTVLLGSLADLVFNKVQLKSERKNDSGKTIITYEYNLSK